jgi:hypothetical protein
MKRRDVELVLSAWATPQPTAGFADRVMVSCAAPRASRPLERPSARGGWWAVAALAVASLLVPLYLSQRPAPPALAAIPVVADLGPLQD